MIAKVLLFVAIVAAARATVVYNSGLGLLNSGLVSPGLAAPALLSSPIASTSTVVATPGAITTDRRVIGAPGLIAGAPLVYGNGLIANGLVGTPFSYANGLVSPLGLGRAGYLAGPGLVKSILK